jgi:hypothetical protein
MDTMTGRVCAPHGHDYSVQTFGIASNPLPPLPDSSLWKSTASTSLRRARTAAAYTGVAWITVDSPASAGGKEQSS